MSNKKCILIITPFYLPGNRAGGPIRSVANIVEALGDSYDFKIITDDREFKGKEPYQDVDINSWNKVGKAQVYYCGADRNKVMFFKRILNELKYDLIYLNSFFHPAFTIIPVLLHKFRQIKPGPVVLAPRGELTPGALAQKKFKKNLYLQLVRLTGLYKNVRWHAASKQEAKNIKQWFGKNAQVSIAENIPGKIDDQITKAGKHPDTLKIIFISRISPKKNILGALEILQEVSSKVDYDIYGPIEDGTYWEECKVRIEEMPANITVSYGGELPHEQVRKKMAEYDLFFMPTFGENYGHVIIEALSAGCPVLISDQTPWNDIEKNGAGWSYALNQPEAFIDKIEKVASANQLTYKNWSENAREYARLKSDREFLAKKTKQIFLP